MSITLIAVFGAFQVILFLMHADIYGSFVAAFGMHWLWLEWLFIFLSITFVSASVLAHKFCNPFVKAYYTLSAYWFGLTQFLFGAAIAFYFFSWIFYSQNYYLNPAITFTICFGVMFIIHTYATWQTARPKFTRITAKLPNIPDFWKGKKIVFISDIHLGAILGFGFSEKVVRLIQKESPEMVLIGGDLFDGVKCHSESIIKPYADLKPPQEIYFASGNHEYIGDTEKMLDEIPDMGIRVLRNASTDIHGIQFVGVDWKDTYKKEDFQNAMSKIKIDRNKPSILMRHEPNHLEVAEQAGVSLLLAGHTHAGQIWPLGYITHRIYKGFDYGFKKLGEMLVYTSSGVGTWGPPLRFGTKSEIVVITLT